MSGITGQQKAFIDEYINLKTFEEIAVSMCYDIRQIHRLHGNALQEFVTKCHSMS